MSSKLAAEKALKVDTEPTCSRVHYLILGGQEHTVRHKELIIVKLLGNIAPHIDNSESVCNLERVKGQTS